MKILIILLCSIQAFAATELKNISLRINSAVDPKNPFIECAVSKAISVLGSSYNLYAVMEASTVGETMPAEFANLRFATKNSTTGKKNIFAIQLRSLDQQNKWQFVSDSSERIFLFSSLVFPEASLINSAASVVGHLNLLSCQ